MTNKKRKAVGTEMFLDTDEGKVRVLAYNLDNAEKLPLYINIHGGGFVLGSAETDDPFMMNIATNANVKILNVDYSLSPEYPFPKAINECYAVAKYAKQHPDEFGIDPERIGMGGQSAGGNATAAICLMEHEQNTLGLKCAVLDYPPVDIYSGSDENQEKIKGGLPGFNLIGRLFSPSYVHEKEERRNPLVSPLFADEQQLATFPPTLVITAQRDPLCKQGEKFKDNLISAGVDVTFKRFDAMHAFNLLPGPEADESWALIIDFLKKTL